MPAPEFDELLGLAGFHRLIGAVAEVVRGGMLPTTDDQRATLTEHHAGWMTQALKVERLLVDVGEAFSRAGLEFRVLKGEALAHLVYPDPALRVFSDLDLLVPSHQFDTAVRVVQEELDGAQAIPELRPGFDREFGKEALVRVGGVELDLHRTFVTGPFGLTVDLDQLFVGFNSLDVAGRSFKALDPNMMFLHACYNAALGDYPVRLCALRDLVSVRKRLGIDIDVIVSTAQDWGATAVVKRASEVTLGMLALEPSADLDALASLAALTINRRDERLLSTYLTAARGYLRPIASLAVIPGLRAKARYARALLKPSTEYLRSRNRTEYFHVRQALGRLRKQRRD